MASTKDKKSKKPLGLVPEAQVESPEIKESLDPSHLLQIETASRDIELAKYRMHVEEQALRNMILEHALLANKIEKQKALLRERANQYEAEKAKFETFKLDIWPKYGFEVSQGLAYNPLSGKISRE